MVANNTIQTYKYRARITSWKYHLVTHYFRRTQLYCEPFIVKVTKWESRLVHITIHCHGFWRPSSAASFFSLRLNWSSNWLLRDQLIFIVINTASLWIIKTNSLHIYRYDDKNCVDEFHRVVFFIKIEKLKFFNIIRKQNLKIGPYRQISHACARKHFVLTERHFLLLIYDTKWCVNNIHINFTVKLSYVNIEDREILKEGTLKWSLNPIINFYWIITNFNENWLLL